METAIQKALSKSDNIVRMKAGRLWTGRFEFIYTKQQTAKVNQTELDHLIQYSVSNSSWQMSLEEL